VERDGVGRSEHFAPVALGPSAQNGTLVTATVVDADAETLIARVPEEATA
jgi:hypothetical protein